MPRPRAALAAAALLLAACAGTLTAPHSGAPGAARDLAAPAPPPWTLPAGELATQSLFRVSYDGPEGEGSFRLTLLLDDAERYQARAVDPLGRALWTLDAAAGRGLWIDHRNRLTCRLDGRFDVAAARLVPVPLRALPGLLLGRVPAAPTGEVERRGDHLAWRDDDGRRWTARLGAGGEVAAWTFWLRGDPVVWWQGSDGGESLLSDRRRGTQLRWHRVLREALPAPPEAVAAPAGYAEVECSQAYGE